MNAGTKNQKTHDYIANHLSKNDKSDFEAEMRMDNEIEIEVARMILKKLKNEQKLQDLSEKLVLEKSTNKTSTQSTTLVKKNNSISNIFGKLFY